MANSLLFINPEDSYNAYTSMPNLFFLQYASMHMYIEIEKHILYMLLNKRFDIGTVICQRAVVLARGRRTARGRRPMAITTARGQITVPISNILFNDNFIT